MRKLLLFLIAVMPFAAQAQSDFEALSLPTTDTYYVNYSMPGKDLGFNNGPVYYPCVYDTGFGATFLSSGFVYSNKMDSVTSGFQNQFSAKPAKGHNNSNKYAVAYGQVNRIRKTNHLHNQWSFIHITNSTFAYNSMRDGDAFAKKFGGASGNDPDWFKVTIRGFLNGSLKADSIDFYLADFRFSNNAQDYIVRDWRQIMLDKLSDADSLQFTLSSSDNGSFGMNTPAYFCLDNIDALTSSVAAIPFTRLAAIAPNPAADYLHLDIKDESVKEALIMDITGRLVTNIRVKSGRVVINTSTFPSGQYLLKLNSKDGVAVTKFIKL